MRRINGSVKMKRRPAYEGSHILDESGWVYVDGKDQWVPPRRISYIEPDEVDYNEVKH